MESRLPKPSFLRKPGGATGLPSMVPSDRMKSSSTQRLPLTRDLINLPSGVRNNISQKRCRSPEQLSQKSHAKLRRSRSAIDLSDLRRPTAAPTRLEKIAETRPKVPNTLNALPSRHKLRRSVSAHDLTETARNRPLKRLGPTLPTIPAKLARTATSTALKTQNSTVTARSKLTASNLTSASTKKPTVPAKTTTTTAKPAAAKKIPPYDYKARFADLLERHKTLKAQHEECVERFGVLEPMVQEYTACKEERDKLEAQIRKVEAELETSEAQCKKLEIRTEQVISSLKTTNVQLLACREKCEKLVDEQKVLKVEVQELTDNNFALTECNSDMKSELEAVKEQLFRSNMERKELHNAVMDLRGNIRVFCRIRPPLEDELNRPLCGWNYLDECSLEVSAHYNGKLARHDFSFDHVFHSQTKQTDIFEMVAPMIQSALDGFNVCIFAYGQTGSGKTFTMDGVADNLGVIPRTVDLLFEATKNYKRLGWEYQIKVTFLEIYNEVLYDLLSNEQKEMEIRMHSAKNKMDVYVSNITEEIVESADHLRELMQIAKMNRATACTVGNERSSRSHAVTRIELIGTHEEKNETCVGTINLVDLAGSESPKTSTRMDETKKINRSLSELSNVILALMQKQEHIPYRNSKLTHLLMPSLGGNSKTLMFINVAPFQDCYVESVNSLRFAASVNSCKLAKAKKNKVLNSSSTSSNSSGKY